MSDNTARDDETLSTNESLAAKAEHAAPAEAPATEPAPVTADTPAGDEAPTPYIPPYAGGERPNAHLRPPIDELMAKFGLALDPWQREVLEANHPRLLLNCCRQSGKTTIIAINALLEAIFRPYTRVLILSASHRQSKLLLDTIKWYHGLLGDRFLKRSTAVEI